MTDILDETSLPTIDPEKKYLQDLVGDDKKFKSNEDLARGKHLSDSYISLLEKRLDASRQEYMDLNQQYNARAKIEELLDQMAVQRSSNDTPIVKDDKIQAPQFDPKQLDVLISNKILENETTKRQQDNANFVRDKIIKEYGSDYQNIVNRQINELGLTREEFNSMARIQPKVLLRSLGLDEQIKQDPFRSPPQSQQRTTTTGPTVEKRTWAYYQDLKKKDPNLWQSKKIAVQMHNDAIALGEDFRDGDYYAYGHT
jgi:hypothetical protein